MFLRRAILWQGFRGESMHSTQTGKQMTAQDLAGLSLEEQEWLAAYRREVERLFPGMPEGIVVFGSKARREARKDSDLDVLVIIKEGNWQLKEAIARPGYLLAVGTDVVPSLMVYTASEWAERRQARAPFWRTVTRDGVAVL